MAFTLVQHVNSTTTASTPITLAFGANITAGNLVVIFVTAGSLATVPTVTDPSNTYANVDRATDSFDGQDCWSFYKLNVTGGQKTVTISQALGTGMAAIMMEWSGVGAGSLTGHNGAGTAVANQAAACSASFGNSGDLVVAGAYINGLGQVPTGTGGITVQDSGAGTDGMADGFINPASGASTPGFSWTATTGNQGWAICGMSFAAAASGPQTIAFDVVF